MLLVNRDHRSRLLRIRCEMQQMPLVHKVTSVKPVRMANWPRSGSGQRSVGLGQHMSHWAALLLCCCLFALKTYPACWPVLRGDGQSQLQVSKMPAQPEIWQVIRKHPLRKRSTQHRSLPADCAVWAGGKQPTAAPLLHEPRMPVQI